MKPKNIPLVIRKGMYRNSIEDGAGNEVARVGLFALVDDSNPVAETLRDEIVIRYNAPELVVEVEVRSIYGNSMIYPANAAAERFAEIAGKKTLSNADLMNIQALGFTVEEVSIKKLVAA